MSLTELLLSAITIVHAALSVRAIPMIMRAGLLHTTIAMKRFVTGTIVFCLMIGAVMPRISFGAEESDTLAKAFRSQSSLLHVFCMTAVPLKIINDIFDARRSPSPVNCPVDSRGRADRGEASSDYSMVNFYAGPVFAKCLQQCGNPQSTAVPVVMAAAFVLLILHRLRESGYGERSVRSSGGMVFFLLPRSSVGDHNVMTCWEAVR